ncbi:MAG TPA: sugar phosphate isomerase/epimerase family protein [Phycisphaerales bacterium]|nr:sugar phosphate isomerase/epimerase family protein [Phycisphaerales bacterium]HRQ75240.1 sugar phosphate isomerase/epimerase family protein [Phycisphaerales bacterium]
MSEHNTRPRQVAVCSWSLQPTNPQQLIEAVSSCGMDAVQLALSPIVEQPELWGRAITMLRDAGITIVSGMMAFRGEDYSTLASIATTGGVRPDLTWPDNHRHAARVAELASQHGIHLVTFHAGFLPHERHDPERSKLLDRLRIIAKLFQDRGIELAFETGQETAATLSAALAELACPNIGVNFDPANMILYGMGDPVSALRHLAQHVRQLHIKDAVASPVPGEWGTEVPAGEGDVDWPGVFEAIGAITRPIDLIIEREAGDHRIQGVRTALRLIRPFIDD